MNSNTKIGQNIRTYRKAKKMTLQDLAAACGVHHSTLSRYENGSVENVSLDTINKIALALGVSLSDIAFIDDDRIYSSAGLDFIRLPLYKSICCGNGGFVDDNVIDYVPVPSQGLDINREHFCMFARGDSMSSMIEDGDLLVFEKTSTPLENSIGAFCIGEDEATCKKYVISNGVVMLKPLNSKYDPILVDIENIRCVGILRKIIRDVE